MRTLRRLLPVICVTILSILIMFLLYSRIMNWETDKCWTNLNNAAKSVNNNIRMKFDDEIVKLYMVATLMIQEDTLDIEQISSLHLDVFQPTTMFSRIDILFPNNIVLSNGVTQSTYNEFSFEDIASKGEHVSPRKTDHQTGAECVYYLLPVEKDGMIHAILIGVIDACSLSEIFQPTIYDGQVNCCLVDSSDGNFIMDNWHDELGNAYAMEERTRAKGYEDVDLKEGIKNHQTDTIAFISKTTGKTLYMYYTPADVFDWQLMIFAPEDILFEDLFYFQKLLLAFGTLQILLLILYFLWNIRIVRQLEKSNIEIEMQKEQLQQISYIDMLTSMYNRNKYTEVFNFFKGQTSQKVGVAYIDLNGLKQINDSQSHTAGDMYIRNTAKAISNVFAQNCYRIGGDEFVVITTAIARDDFTAKISELMEIIKEENISLSIGFLWEEVCTDLEALLKEAEQLMYKEKERYYLTHDRRGRR